MKKKANQEEALVDEAPPFQAEPTVPAASHVETAPNPAYAGAKFMGKANPGAGVVTVPAEPAKE